MPNKTSIKFLLTLIATSENFDERLSHIKILFWNKYTNMIIYTDDGQIEVANPRLLPYIAMIHELCLDAALEIYVPIPAIRRGLWRVVYVSQDLIRWVEVDLPNIKSRHEQDPLPVAQLDAELRSFCNGEVCVYDRDFKCLRPIDKGIWEFKTPDLRLVFWFIAKDVVVLHKGGDANWLHEILHDTSRYTPLIEATASFRESCPNLPIYIPGVRSENVVSNRIR